MSLLLSMLAVIAGGVVLYGAMLLLASRKGRCPSCGKRALETNPHEGGLGTGSDAKGQRFPYSLEVARCGACQVEWRNYNNNGWVTKQAYDAGATEPIPSATVR